jgi:predicted lipid-binding transport protein (Tim44 family)
MRIYQSSTGGLWIGILLFIFILMSFLAIGGFLLGTPIGLAILTLLVIRHFYKRHQRKKYQEQYGSAFSGQGFSWFSQNEQTEHTTEASDTEESKTVFSDDFASQYKQSEQEIKTFSHDDKYNAVDVEYKEL